MSSICNKSSSHTFKFAKKLMNDRLKWKKLERNAVGGIWVVGVPSPAVAMTIIFNITQASYMPQELSRYSKVAVFTLLHSMVTEILPHMI